MKHDYTFTTTTFSPQARITHKPVEGLTPGNWQAFDTDLGRVIELSVRHIEEGLTSTHPDHPFITWPSRDEVKSDPTATLNYEQAQADDSIILARPHTKIAGMLWTGESLSEDHSESFGENLYGTEVEVYFRKTANAAGREIFKAVRDKYLEVRSKGDAVIESTIHGGVVQITTTVRTSKDKKYSWYVPQVVGFTWTGFPLPADAKKKLVIRWAGMPLFTRAENTSTHQPAAPEPAEEEAETDDESAYAPF